MSSAGDGTRRHANPIAVISRLEPHIALGRAVERLDAALALNP